MALPAVRADVIRSLLSPHQRRHAIGLSYANGAIWALGNGLASTSLVIYLALELDARGSAIGYILAAPALVGALRWWAAGLIGRMVDRKRFCISLNGSRWVQGGADLAFPACVIGATLT